MIMDKKVLKEIEKFNTIKQYIKEQEDTMEPESDLGDLGVSDDMESDELEPLDVDTDPDVEVVGNDSETIDDTSEGGTEELEITDLVNSQTDILNKLGNLDSVMTSLETLNSKIGEIDQIINKIDNLEAKVEKYKPKSPEQKLELRSLDSYPFNQKLTDFFDDKEVEFDKSGKSEYVLTSDEVENFSDMDIKDSFDDVFEEQ